MPKTQPHYGGWLIYDELMAKFGLLPNSNPKVEHLRGDIVKRMGRLGEKGDPCVDIDKALSQLAKLQEAYEGYQYPLLNNGVAGFGIIDVLRRLPAGFDTDGYKVVPKDQKRLEVIIAMAIGEFTPKIKKTLERLKEHYQ